MNKKQWEKIFASPIVTIFASVLVTFLVGMFFAKIGGGVPISVTQTTTEKKSTFDMEGVGESVVVPDEAKMSFGVEVTADSVELAQEEVNEMINSLQTSLKKIGIDKKDIQTTSYNVYPDYDYSEGRSTVVGYRVSSRIEVGFKDFTKVNKAIMVAGELELNQVGQLSFGLSDEAEEKALSEAREKAVSKAKSKAKELAYLAGVNLGKVINVSEQVQGNYEPRPMLAMAERAVSDDEESRPQIEPGSEKLRVSVTLSYATE